MLVMIVLSAEGRVAWYGEREFEDVVQSLEKEGYTIEYIDTIDKETLLMYDVLVVCLREPTKSQKEVIDDFVKNGGGLLLIYDAVSSEKADILSAYKVENTLKVDEVFPFLTEDVVEELPSLIQKAVEELKKQVSVSQKEGGNILLVGYDPLTFDTLSSLMDAVSIFGFGLDKLFSIGMDWLCQDWHVEQTQAVIAEKQIKLVVPAVVVVALLVVVGYVLQKRKKEKPELTNKEEQIRELKARFVYGELSRDEYRQELEKLERSAK